LKANISNPAFLVDNLFDSELPKKATRDGYGEGLLEAGKADSRVVALCADLTESTRTLYFKEAFPERFFEVGVAEQNLVGMAAGLALDGKIPFAASFGIFSPGRSWGQVRLSVCYNEANVKLAGSHTGLTVGADGATHQALEDMAITRCIPNMTVLAPCDFLETKKATMAAARHVGPVYIRFAREKTPMFTTERTPFEIGKAQIFKPGTDVAIVACGITVYRAIEAAKLLGEEGISAMVVNNPTIKPIDHLTLIEAAKSTGALVTVEDHQMMAGMGSAVAEVIVRHFPVPMEFVGVNDVFGESGKPEELLAKHGINAEGIAGAVHRVLERK
jgi:transketolase